MLTANDVEEALSLAYVSAVAARVGVDMSFTRKDYGIDGTFRPIRDVAIPNQSNIKKMSSGFPIDFQLKASKNCYVTNTHIGYDLKVESHAKLIERHAERGTPIILIVHALPDNDIEWLIHSEDELLLRRCCYWCIVSGSHTSNSGQVRVNIPRAQQFTPNALEDLLSQARAGTLI